MPRRFIKKYLPDPEIIRQHRSLRVFGSLIHSPNLWHLNKRSVSGAFAVGLFCAFVPIPFQMVLAALLALVFRVNLPIAIALVWITNPVTIPPMFWTAYQIGASILDVPVQKLAFELSGEWLKTEFLRVWQPFLLGCFIMASGSALSGFVTIRVAWRLVVMDSWRRRREMRRLRRELKKLRKEDKL
jgi:uncharacterized protein (DUF2062 family)